MLLLLRLLLLSASTLTMTVTITIRSSTIITVAIAVTGWGFRSTDFCNPLCREIQAWQKGQSLPSGHRILNLLMDFYVFLESEGRDDLGWYAAQRVQVGV